MCLKKKQDFLIILLHFLIICFNIRKKGVLMKVFVYFNLHKKCWSIKALSGEHKGKVIGHSNYVELENCIMKVSESGRQRVIREKQKNVHAGVVGWLVSKDIELKCNNKQITYNPYRFSSFVDKTTLEPVFESSKAFMIKGMEGIKVCVA